MSEQEIKNMVKGCLGKPVFRTFKHARKVARDKSVQYGRLTSTYLCPTCGFYHLTTVEQRINS